MEFKKMKWKELIKHIECSDVLVECEWLVAVSRKCWKVNSVQEFLGQGTVESCPIGILGPAHFHAS